jgi:hypothetical protein
MRNVILPDMLKISVGFFALQMLILSAAELQIRQDERHGDPEYRTMRAGLPRRFAPANDEVIRP